MKTKALFLYFRITGKYYSEQLGEISEDPLHHRDEVRKMRAAGQLPGITDGTSFIIVVMETPEGPGFVPFLLLPEGM